MKRTLADLLVRLGVLVSRVADALPRAARVVARAVEALAAPLVRQALVDVCVRLLL